MNWWQTDDTGSCYCTLERWLWKHGIRTERERSSLGKRGKGRGWRKGKMVHNIYQQTSVAEYVFTYFYISKNLFWTDMSTSISANADGPCDAASYLCSNMLLTDTRFLAIILGGQSYVVDFEWSSIVQSIGISRYTCLSCYPHFLKQLLQKTQTHPTSFNF